MRVLFWQNTKGGIIAVETINYNRFKESCEEFKSAFSDSFFSSGRLFCHPLLDGVIYTPCSPEEAKSNSMDICRMADMLLMSADGKQVNVLLLRVDRRGKKDSCREWNCLYLKPAF